MSMNLSISTDLSLWDYVMALPETFGTGLDRCDLSDRKERLWLQ